MKAWLQRVARWALGQPAATPVPLAPAEPQPAPEPPAATLPEPLLAVLRPLELNAGERWHALPGQRIELEDTGFAIVMNRPDDHWLYTLYSPEGRVLAYGGDLPGLKSYGERHARDRSLFQLRGAR